VVKKARAQGLGFTFVATPKVLQIGLRQSYSGDPGVQLSAVVKWEAHMAASMANQQMRFGSVVVITALETVFRQREPQREADTGGWMLSAAAGGNSMLQITAVPTRDSQATSSEARGGTGAIY
jgi:hypothetical protein